MKRRRWLRRRPIARRRIKRPKRRRRQAARRRETRDRAARRQPRPVHSAPALGAAAAPQASQFWQLALEKRYQIGAVAAGLALAGVLTMASIAYKAQQNDYLVSQSAETQIWPRPVKALKARSRLGCGKAR